MHLQRRHEDEFNYVQEMENAPPPEKKNNQTDNASLDKITEIIERFSTRLLDSEREARTALVQKLIDTVNREDQHRNERHGLDNVKVLSF